MLTAFLLVTTEIGSETKVLRLLETIDAVEEVYLVYSSYDIVAKTTTQSMDELKEIIASHLVRSNGVRSTSTMIVLTEKQIFNTLPTEVPTLAS